MFVMSRFCTIQLGALVVAVLCGLFFAVPDGLSEEIFRYRDPDGVVHFSNAPTDGRFSRVGPGERPSGSVRSEPGEVPASGTPEASGEASVTAPTADRAPATDTADTGGAAATASAPLPAGQQSGVVQPTAQPPRTIVRMIEATAVRYRIEKALLSAIVRAESGYDPRAVSRSGAAGLMQLMPETAASLGVRDVFHPQQNLDGGALYFRRLLHRFEGDPVLALAAFNAGPTAVEKYGGIPPFPETRSYVRRVSAYRQEYLRAREGLPHMVRMRKVPES